MGSRRPSKKRNALLMFEFLTKEAARRVVAGDSEGSELVIGLIKEAFAPGTELYKELRLARSLLLTKVSSAAVAAHILTEARGASKSLNAQKLDAEKSKLILTIEQRIDPTGALYDAQLTEYRLLATIGTLMSDWRVGSHDFQRIGEYEDQLMDHLTTRAIEENHISEDPSERMSPGERRALIAVMSRKLEEKWGKSLTKDQKDLLRDYVLAKDNVALLERLRSIRLNAIRCLNECRFLSEKSEYFMERVNESKQTIADRVFDEVNNENVSLGMLYLKLISEAEEQK